MLYNHKHEHICVSSGGMWKYIVNNIIKHVDLSAMSSLNAELIEPLWSAFFFFGYHI